MTLHHKTTTVNAVSHLRRYHEKPVAQSEGIFRGNRCHLAGKVNRDGDCFGRIPPRGFSTGDVAGNYLFVLGNLPGKSRRRGA